ncbi:MAG: hypothetical protein COW59_08590 [Lysobacterales bacterium CG17_big_fil_post_rev_8_21_14_2_50_64_11]|nr:MAG: hypothetical protein COW59_08590 [Xanthomonadales bacterium CG17_big_fil_post_rev_8_21_14_2_50_64_11]PIX60600.1 MAG: hypothetical protein COZ47_06325 [Xanthomonadales bacterium CG_4_10_14_3_um_filter_64_11]
MHAMAWQYVLLALALLWSVGYVTRRQFPAVLRAVRVRLALWLMASSRPAWQRRLGRKLAPPPAVAARCAVGSACGGCEKTSGR